MGMPVGIILPYHTVIKKPPLTPLPENLITVGNHIRTARLQRGLLQKNLADLFKVSEDSVTGWESGRSIPQLQYYPGIISFLGYYPFSHETETIAGKLRQWRNCCAIPILDACQILHADSRTIRKWESKKSNPPRIHSVHIESLWMAIPNALKLPLNLNDNETEQATG